MTVSQEWIDEANAAIRRGRSMHPEYPFTNERTGQTEWLTAIDARSHPQAAHLRRQSNRPRPAVWEQR